MRLLINIENSKITVILKKKDEIDSMSFLDEHNLTEKLLFSIDELLKRNKLEIYNIRNIQVESNRTNRFTTERIAKTTAKIINQMKDKSNI